MDYPTSDVYYWHCLQITGETNSIELVMTKNEPAIYIDFKDPNGSRNVTRDQITTPGETLVSELVITNESNGAWIKYKINGASKNSTGSSLLKDGEDRIIRPMHPRCIRSIWLYAIENPDNTPLTTATVRLNCIT